MKKIILMVLIFAILVSGCAKEIEEVIPQSPEIKTDITDARAHFDEGIEYYELNEDEEFQPTMPLRKQDRVFSWIPASAGMTG